MITRIEKSGAIGFIADADLSDFEQPMNSWSRVDNIRMRNYGCETILDRVVVDVTLTTKISELSYINNDNGLFHVLWGNGAVASLSEENVLRDISHAQTAAEEVLNGDFSGGLTSWTNSGVSVISGACNFPSPTPELCPDPDITFEGTDWTYTTVADATYPADVAWPVTATQNADGCARWYTRDKNVFNATPATPDSYIECDLSATAAGSLGVYCKLGVVKFSGYQTPITLMIYVQLLNAADTVLETHQETLIADLAGVGIDEYKIIDFTQIIGSGLVGIAKVRVYPYFYSDWLSINVLHFNAWEATASAEIEQALTLVNGDPHVITFTITGWDDSKLAADDAGAYSQTVGVGSTFLKQIPGNGTFSYEFDAGASNDLTVTNSSSIVGFNIDDISVRSGSFINNVYPTNIWVVDKLHGVTGATNQISPPVYLPEDAAVTTNIDYMPNWGKQVSTDTVDNADNDLCQVIAAYKNFFVACNITAGDQSGIGSAVLTAGEEYPSMVRWSDASDTGSVPANWYIADPTTLAGQVTVGGDMGGIIAAETLRDDLILYGELGTSRMSYIGGQSVMGFKPMFERIGIYGPRCVVSYKNMHYMITQDDLVKHDGQNIETIADKRVRRDIFDNIRQVNRNAIHLALIKERGEIWVCIDTSRTYDDTTIDGEYSDNYTVNMAYVYSVEEDTWSKRDLESENVIRELPRLDEVVDNNYQFQTYRDMIAAAGDTTRSDVAAVSDDSSGYGIDSYDGIGDVRYSRKIKALGDLSIYSGNDTEYSEYDKAGAVTGVLDRESINITGDENTAVISAIYPRINGNKPVTIQVGGQDKTGGEITWKASKDFTPGQGYRVTFKCRGRRHAVRFSGEDFRLEGYDIEWKEGGKR